MFKGWLKNDEEAKRGLCKKSKMEFLMIEVGSPIKKKKKKSFSEKNNFVSTTMKPNSDQNPSCTIPDHMVAQ